MAVNIQEVHEPDEQLRRLTHNDDTPSGISIVNIQGKFHDILPTSRVFFLFERHVPTPAFSSLE